MKFDGTDFPGCDSDIAQKDGFMAASGDLAGLEVGFDIPALPGMALAEVQTPCLIVDLDALERNIVKLGDFARAEGIRLRPYPC